MICRGRVSVIRQLGHLVSSRHIIFTRWNHSKRDQSGTFPSKVDSVKFEDKLQKVIQGNPSYEHRNRSLDDEKLREIIETSNFRTRKDESSKEVIDRKQPITISSEGSPTNSSPVTNSLEDDIKLEIPDLPSDKEKKRSKLAKRLEIYLDSLQDTIFTATRALNDVTGYSSIEKLKKSIDTLETELKEARDRVKSCKELYSEAIHRRSQLQKEVNELLTRKHDWSLEDLERFTNLYRNDHANEQGEQTAHSELESSEKKVDSIQLKLTQLILTRYHEEQIWSDKIRRASTWGTWIIMGLNMLLFIVATFLVEPWKRKRLVGSFEDKVKLALYETSEQQNGRFDEMLQRQSKNVTPIEPSTNSTNGDEPSGLSGWFFKSKPSELLDVSKPQVMQLSLESSWTGNIKQNVEEFLAEETNAIQLQKNEFGVLMGVLAVFGLVLGGAITFFSK